MSPVETRNLAFDAALPHPLLKNWEQGRRRPTGPARALLKIVQSDPEGAVRALQGQQGVAVVLPGSKDRDRTLADIRAKVRAAGICSQAIILVGPVLKATDFADSRLYAPDFSHRFRKANAKG